MPAGIQSEFNFNACEIARSEDLNRAQIVNRAAVIGPGFVEDINAFKREFNLLCQGVRDTRFKNSGVVDIADPARAIDELLEVVAAIFIYALQVELADLVIKLGRKHML